MDRKLVWSPEATEDVEAIARYIERDSSWYARVVVNRILAVAESIVDFPEIGRVVPEVGDSDIRERFVYSYRVIYRIYAQRIRMIAVIHGSRLMQHAAPDIADR